MLRVDTVPRVAGVIQGHPGRDRADVQLVCGPVRTDHPPVAPDLAVAVPGRSRRPNPAGMRVGRVDHDLREQALLKRPHSAASAARAARIASRPFASAACTTLCTFCLEMIESPAATASAPR